MASWFEELFPGGGQTEAERLAGLAAAEVAEAERLAAVKAAATEAAAAKAALACPKCGGGGYLAHFSHYKAGSCFLCGGTGIFSKG
jgi:hypothetical protein